jgi:mannose-6-phosphate isomerase-like protein (cupin superfamily)
MDSFTTTGLLVVEAGAGEPRWIGASRITTKATAGQTHGGFGLIVSEVTRDTSSPLHIHHTADESMWVMSGRVRVRCGDDEFPLAAGAFAFLPRGVPHTFIAEEDTAMLGLITPGGTEAFFAEGGPVATSATPPPPDLERLQRAAGHNQCEFVGPPLSPSR